MDPSFLYLGGGVVTGGRDYTYMYPCAFIECPGAYVSICTINV